MTACTNHGGKARRVVTAALVGVLSVGTVPMVALATGAEPTDGIETMAAEWYTGAKVTKATDGKGKTLTGDLSKVTLEAGTGKYLAPTEIANGFETTKVNTNDYVFIYYTSKTDAEAKNANWVAASNSSNAAKTPAGYFQSQTAAQTYYLVIAKKTASGTSSATEYTAPIAFVTAKSEAAQGVHVDGTLTYKGSVYADSEFKFVDADGNEIKPDGTISFTKASDGTSTTATDAGDYYAQFTSDGHSYSVPFSIAKLDLSKATLTVDDQQMTGGTTNPVSSDTALIGVLKVNGVSTSAFSGATFSVTKVVDPKMSGSLNSGAGEYTVTISVDDANTSIVASSGTVTYSVVNWDIFGNPSTTEFTYGRQDLLTNNDVTVSLLDGESFDASKISVEYDGEKIAADGLEVSYAKVVGSTNEACEASDLAQQGDYVVTVRVKPFSVFGGSDVLGGTRTIDVKVVGTEVDKQTGIGFYVDGELAGEDAHVDYDGTDWLEKVSAVVKDEDGNELVEGTDYELEVTLDGKEVTEAVNASSDAYEIKIVPLTFSLTGTSSDTFKLYVDPVTVTRLVADVSDMKYDVNESDGMIPTNNNDDDDTTNDGAAISNEFYVKYTGSAVEVPGVKYQVEKDGEYTYVTLDPSLYNVVSVEKGSKVVEEAVEKGDYTVTIALTDEANGNYSLSSDTFTFTVRAYGQFTDVASDAWYAVPVEKAYKNAYINGIAGTNLYAPNTQITRADVACILFNMAGGNVDDKGAVVGSNEFGFNENSGYITGFSDVDGHAYYAKAIAWAHASGVVNGHDGEFRPMDKITREEFASMLANFAKVKGDYKASDGSALAGLSDAASVSDWAEANVAWAVENGIMGNGGSVNATAQITRAEVAAMAVNYQPEPLVEVADR